MGRTVEDLLEYGITTKVIEPPTMRLWSGDGEDPDKRVWSHPTLGVTDKVIAEQKKKNRNAERWHDVKIVNSLFHHTAPANKVIWPLAYPLPQIDCEGADKVRFSVQFKPLSHSGKPGKWFSFSLNGGFRGGFSRKGGKLVARPNTCWGWKEIGGTCNLMHPAVGGGNTLGLFIAHRGMRSDFGKSYGPRPPKLRLDRWYNIEVVAHLREHRWELRLDNELVAITPPLKHLLFEGKEIKKAHAYLRFMNGGNTPALIQKTKSASVWRHLKVEAIG